jgi:hypothetical protein
MATLAVNENIDRSHCLFARTSGKTFSNQ